MGGVRTPEHKVLRHRHVEVLDNEWVWVSEWVVKYVKYACMCLLFCIYYTLILQYARELKTTVKL